MTKAQEKASVKNETAKKELLVEELPVFNLALLQGHGEIMA